MKVSLLQSPHNSGRLSIQNNHLSSHRSFLSKFMNMDTEVEYLNKLQITENNIKEIFSYKKMKLKNEYASIQQENLSYQNLVAQINEENKILQKKFEDLRIQFNELTQEFNKLNEMKQKLNKEIIQLRHESSTEVEGQLAKKAKGDKYIRQLKKEFCLLVNILKYRIVNYDTAKKENAIKGYLLNINNNAIKFFGINRDDIALKNYLNFWNSLNTLLGDDNKNNDDNKENANTN